MNKSESKLCFKESVNCFDEVPAAESSVLIGNEYGKSIWIKCNFQGDEAILVKQCDVWHAAMQPLIEALGLDWEQQHRKIHKGSFSQFYKTASLLGDGETKSVMLLPLDKINEWLFSISSYCCDKAMQQKLHHYKELFCIEMRCACPPEPVAAETLRKLNRNNTLECSGLPLFRDVAKGLKIGPMSLYRLLNKERVLYRLRGKPRSSDEREHFGRVVTYAEFTGKNLFKREIIIHEHSDGTGSTSNHLKVTPKGISFIAALLNNRGPSAKDIYNQISN